MTEQKLAELPLFGTNVDKSQVPPIHQKRITAFVNTFVTETTEFLDKLIEKCETQFMTLEMKLNRIETEIQLVESKLVSVPAEAPQPAPTETPVVSSTLVTEVDSRTSDPPPEPPQTPPASSVPEPSPSEEVGVKAKDDYRYKKYFKMIHFGVPVAAVKQKVSSEGLDPDIIDSPDMILPDGETQPPPADNSDDSDD